MACTSPPLSQNTAQEYREYISLPIGRSESFSPAVGRSFGIRSPPFAATLAQLPFPHFCAIRPLPPEDRGALTTHWVLEGVSLGATIRADTYGPAWRRAGIDGCEICADPLPGGPAAGDVVARAGPAVVVAFRREETSALLKYTPSCRTVRNSETPEADGNSPPHPIDSGAT